MATNYGVRPIGSDGTDFMHRQRIASHYQIRCSPLTLANLQFFRLDRPCISYLGGKLLVWALRLRCDINRLAPRRLQIEEQVYSTVT